jgi:NAD(P)-dependent dehydrogenase (short-subunit alcohol dehydrogenase family)
MSEASALLRPGLLAGVAVLVAGVAEPAGVSDEARSADSADTNDPLDLGVAVSAACAQLGARVSACAADAFVGEAPVEETVGTALAAVGPLDLLVVDGAGLFARGLARCTESDGDDGERAGDADVEDAQVALSACLDAAWNVTRAVVNLAFLAGEPGPTAGGRVVYLAPPPDAGAHAEAARAGLENLARTLSIEWARHGVTLVAIAPGSETAAGEVAALCAFLASPAGAYFSGCLLDLRSAR